MTMSDPLSNPLSDPLLSAQPDSLLREDMLRVRAVRRLKKQRDFRVHLLIYVLVNAFLVVIWAMSSPFGGAIFFWPIFPIVGWGIGVAVSGYDAYGRDTLTEDRIQREMNRLQRSG
jgi:hypothetical protein